MNTESSDKITLFSKAARCYLGAGLLVDACRCFEAGQDFMRAAHLYEQQRYWLKAAHCYTQALAWLEAARCYLQAEVFTEAADCLRKGGDSLQAGWVLAQHVERYAQAWAVVETVQCRTVADQVAREIILARCEAGQGTTAAACKRLYQAILQLRQLPIGSTRQQVEQWALIVTDTLQRHDLTALIHANAVTSGMPQAGRQWEAWAMGTLNDATGIPT